jgi:hypothetical protein
VATVVAGAAVVEDPGIVVVVDVVVVVEVVVVVVVVGAVLYTPKSNVCVLDALPPLVAFTRRAVIV